jgi:hypothetical protein
MRACAPPAADGGPAAPLPAACGFCRDAAIRPSRAGILALHKGVRRGGLQGRWGGRAAG